ncbi:MAG: hypothetical protein IKR17_07105 [Bacteroidales bacterium]|nr:hypothetical protein [Bacteroidales bacterium]
MDKYIQELISTESRVIVPAFGAFTMERNAEGKVDIAFNKWLNFDDHILSEYVAQKRGIAREEAEKLIADFANKLNNQLETENRTSIAGVGVFEKSESGIVKFEADANAVDTVATAEPEVAVVADSEASAKEEPAETAEENKADENIAPATPAAEPAETKEEVKPTYVNNTTNYYGQKRSNTWIWIVLIVLLFLLLAWVLLFVVNKDNVVYRYFYPEPTEVVEQPIAQPDTVVAEPVKEPVEKTSLSRRYNIVVGSYKDRPSADKKVENLHERGFKDAFVADYTNEHGHWFIAVIEEHSTLVEAEARQEYIVDNYRIESWITNGGE